MAYFSVIIPVYNKQPHISRSIGSVLHQSYKNFELIVVDDGSSDGSLEEIKKFKDNRIKLVFNEKPTGPSAARNKGIKQAKGEWISFLDADDEWEDTYLENVFQGTQNYPEANIVSCGYNISKGNNNISQDKYYLKHSTKGDHLYDIKTYLSGPRPICTSVATIKRVLMVRSGGFNEVYRHGEDVELWLRLMLEYNATGLWLFYLGATYYKKFGEYDFQ